MTIFGKLLHNLLDFILRADLDLGPTYLNKVDLEDAYMRIWVFLTDISYVDFLVPMDKENDPQLVVFNLSTPMGYMESAPIF